MQRGRRLLGALWPAGTTALRIAPSASPLRVTSALDAAVVHSRFSLRQPQICSNRHWMSPVESGRWTAPGSQVASQVRLVSSIPTPVGQQSRKWRLSVLFLFVPCIATFGLGTWQIFRRQWKIEVLDYRRKRLEEEPIPLVSAVASNVDIYESVDPKAVATKAGVDDLEFRQVICEGVYDEKNNLYVGPRARSAYGVTQKGFYVITPLSTTDGSKSVQVPVLVNRGWVPSGWLDESAAAHTVESLDMSTNHERAAPVPWWKFWTRNQSSAKNQVAVQSIPTVKVRGVIRRSEQPNMFVPSNVPKKGEWFYVDVPAMASTVGLPEDTILIEVVQDSKKSDGPTKETFPVPKDPEALLHSSVMPQDHINYALTWYSLSAATTFMAAKRVRGAMRGL